MRTDTGVFGDLPLQVKDAICDFQRYVVRENDSRSPHWAQAQRMIQKVAEYLVESLPEPEPPVKPEKVAQLFQITIHFGNSNANSDGHLIPKRGGFDLILEGANSSEAFRVRQRFTIAHECGHVLFFTEDRGSLRPIIPRELERAWREEGLCHAFARALLIPEPHAAAVAALGPGVTTLLTAARRFRVSVEGVVRRLLHDLYCWPDSVFYRIAFPEGKLKVDCFRGIDRKSPRGTPTGPQVESLLDGKLAEGQIVKFVTEAWQLKKADIGLVGRDIWFRL